MNCFKQEKLNWLVFWQRKPFEKDVDRGLELAETLTEKRDAREYKVRDLKLNLAA